MKDRSETKTVVYGQLLDDVDGVGLLMFSFAKI